MSDIDPASTAGPDGGEATIGPNGTVDRTEHEFEPELGSPGELPDSDGDGETDIEYVRSMDEIEAQQEADAIWAREQRAEEVAAAEAEAAEQAARDAAAAAGEPYHLESGTFEGEPVEIFLMPDGSIYTVDASGEVVAVAYPEDPVYVGQVYSGGEALEVYELFDGSQVVVSDGQLVGHLDDVEHDTIPIDPLIAGTMGIDPELGVEEVYTVPMGPPTYDTYVVDAATGETVGELNTGHELDVLGIEIDAVAYSPPGADYTMHVEDGEVVDIVPNPEEPEWSFLGIVEYYEDGTVSVDLAVVEVEVDLVGDEKGISIGADLFFIEVGAGIEWDSDGNWDFEAYVDVDLPGLEFGAGVLVGWEDGEFSVGTDMYVDMQLGIIRLEGEGGFDLALSEDGVALSGDMQGSMSVLGAHVGTEYSGGVSIGPGGIEAHAEAGIVVGHDWVGEFGLRGGAAFETDGTLGGTSAGGGAGVSGTSTENAPWASGSVGGFTNEAGLRASTDAGIETYGGMSGAEREESDRNGLDTDWHDDMGVGDQMSADGEAEVDAEVQQPSDGMDPGDRHRLRRDGDESGDAEVAAGARSDDVRGAGAHADSRSGGDDETATETDRVRDVFDELSGVDPAWDPELRAAQGRPAERPALDRHADDDAARSASPPELRPDVDESPRDVSVMAVNEVFDDPITDAPVTSRAPEPLVPEPATPDTVTPDTVTPETVTLETVATEPVTPETVEPSAGDVTAEPVEVLPDPVVEPPPLDVDRPTDVEPSLHPIDTDLPDPEPLG